MPLISRLNAMAAIILLAMPLCPPVHAAPQFIGARSVAGSAVLLVVNDRDLGNAGGQSQVLALRDGMVRVLVHKRSAPFGELVPSPDGQHVAFTGCCTPERAGLWSFERAGNGVQHILAPPHSPCGNRLTIGSIAWAPGGRRLAYHAWIGSDAYLGCPSGTHDAMGTWVTPYAHPQPRQLTIERTPLPSGPVSWSPDGRTLVVNTGGGIAAVDVARSTLHLLIRGARQGVFGPHTGTLAYVTGGARPGNPTVIWAAGTEGRHRHVLATTSVPLSELVEHPLMWSPDGRSIAYLTDTGTARRTGTQTLWVVGAVSHRSRALVSHGGRILSMAWSPDSRLIACVESAPGGNTFVSTIDVASAISRRVLYAGQGGAHLLPRSQFSSVAWLPTVQ